MGRPPRPPLAVTGTCPKCKAVVNTTAEKGRTTWRGPCSTVGCSGRVIARRAPVQPSGAARGKRPAAGAPAPEPPASTTKGRQRRRIPRVEYERGADPGRSDRPPAGTQGPPAPVREGGSAGGRPAGDGDEHDYRDAGGLPEGEHTVRARPVDEHGEPAAQQPRGAQRSRRQRSDSRPRRSPYPHLYDW